MFNQNAIHYQMKEQTLLIGNINIDNHCYLDDCLGIAGYCNTHYATNDQEEIIINLQSIDVRKNIDIKDGHIMEMIEELIDCDFHVYSKIEG